MNGITKLEVVDGARCTPVALEFDESITQAEWLKVLKKLLRSGRMLQWWIGDCLAFGQTKWGETVKHLRELTEYADGSLWNMAYVSRQVEPSLRGEELPWSCYREIAPLPPREQKKWVELAKKEEWPVVELRKRIRAAHATHSLEEPDYKPHESPTRLAHKLSDWLKQQPEEFWTEERRLLWRSELQPLYDFYLQLWPIKTRTATWPHRD